jgi:hypothetical protein
MKFEKRFFFPFWQFEKKENMLEGEQKNVERASQRQVHL